MARSRLAALAAGLLGLLVLIGALAFYRPCLGRDREAFAEVPSPPALFGASAFTVPPHGSACMSQVTVTPDSALVSFGLRPVPGRAVGPPVDLTLTAPGYHAVVHVPGGYPGGAATLPVAAPRRPVIATACFTNRGRAPVLLTGTIEPRTISRSRLVLDGQEVFGDISIGFLQARPTPLIDRLGQVFGRASNLTDGLIPAWLVWVIAILVAFGVPAGIVAAFWTALAEDEAGAGLVRGSRRRTAPSG
jgi:hypothetical protein